jgi:hypothetical protein
MLSRKVWPKAVFGLSLAVVCLALAAPAGAAPEKLNLEKWLAPDADVVMAINVRQMLDSPAVKNGGLPALKDALKQNEEATTLLKEVGVDPFKDIDSVLISGKAKGKNIDKARVVVRGRFDLEKFHGAAEKYAKKDSDAIKVSKVGDVRLYELAGDGKKSFAAFQNKNTLVLTLTKEDTLDLVKNGGKKAVPMSKQLKAATAKVTGKESMAMALVVNDEMKDLLGKVPQTAEVAPKLQTVNATLTLTDAATLAIRINTSDAASAKKAGMLLRQFKAVAALFVMSSEDLPPVAGDLLEAIKISAERDSVIVDLKVTKEMIDKAGKKE